MTENKIVNIFWTGGWDSTYRIVELSRIPVSIQPIYINDPSRLSQEQELSAMNTITQLLQQRKQTQAVFLPIKQINLSSLPCDSRVEKAWKSIASTIHIGTQYKWLPVVAKKYPGIELCIEKPSGPRGGCTSTLHKFGKLIQNPDKSFKLDVAASTPECSALFENVTFPILSLTEHDMLANIKAWQYEDIMKHIWFCNNPLQNHCCGMCVPCIQKMTKEMDFLLDSSAQARYFKMKSLAKFVGGTRVASKLMREFYKIYARFAKL